MQKYPIETIHTPPPATLVASPQPQTSAPSLAPCSNKRERGWNVEQLACLEHTWKGGRERGGKSNLGDVLWFFFLFQTLVG